MSFEPSPLKSPIPVTGQPVQNGRLAVEGTAPLLRSQIWLTEPLVTPASVWPSPLKSAVPLTLQPDGTVNGGVGTLDAVSPTTLPAVKSASVRLRLPDSS